MKQVIEDIMTRDIRSVGARSSLAQVAEVMRDCKIGDVLVTGDDGELRGIVTDRDLVVRAMADGRSPTTTAVGDICTAQLVTLGPDASVEDAVRLMRENAIRRIPVVDDGRAIGIVSIGDLAKQNDPRSALAQISSASPNN